MMDGMNKDIPGVVGVISEDVSSRVKRKKAKKRKREKDVSNVCEKKEVSKRSNMSPSKSQEKVEVLKMETNTSEMDGMSHDIPVNESEGSGNSSQHLKAKERNYGIELTMSADITSNDGDVLIKGRSMSNELTGDKKRKKTKKKKTENLDELHECDIEEQDTTMKETKSGHLPGSGDPPNLSIKKSKKRKTKRELSNEKVSEKPECDLGELDVSVKGQASSDVLPCSADVAEESCGRKKKKSKKRKHEFSTEERNEKPECDELKVSDASAKQRNIPACRSDESGVAKESSIHKKKKSKKHKHELSAKQLDEKPMCGELKDKNAKERAENVDMLACGVDSGVAEESSIDKKKKSKEHKHELLTEQLNDKPKCDELKDGNAKEKTGNVDLPACAGVDSGVAEESTITEKQKSKKNKHDFSAEQLDKEPECEKLKDANTSTKEKTKSVDIPACGDDLSVSEESIIPKKKKSKKHKRDLAAKQFGKKPECVEFKDGDTSATEKIETADTLACRDEDSRVSEGLFSHRKKAKKLKQDLSERNPSVTEEKSSDTSVFCSDVGKESGGHEKKNLNEQDNMRDLSVGEVNEKREQELMILNTPMMDVTGSDVLSRRADVQEESCVGKKKKAKKHKHEKVGTSLEYESKPVDMSAKEEKSVDVLGCYGDISKESNVNKKKKLKKQKHDLWLAKLDTKAACEIEGNNTAVAKQPSSVITELIADLPVELMVDEKWKKISKKHKHEKRLSAEKIAAKPEYEEKEVCTSLQQENSAGITLDSKGNSDKKGTKRSGNDVESESNVDMKKKKSKKREQDKELSTDEMEKMDCEEKKADTTEQPKVIADNLACDGDVVQNSSDFSTDKTESNMRNVSVNEEAISDVRTHKSDIEDGSGGHRKGKKSKKHKHENDISNGELDAETQCRRKEISKPVKEETTRDISASKCDVEVASRVRKEKKKSKELELEDELSKNLVKENVVVAGQADLDNFQVPEGNDECESAMKSMESNLDFLAKTNLEEEETTNTSEAGTDLDETQNEDAKTTNQWESAQFTSSEEKQKFLRLMGAFKPSAKIRETSNYSKMAMNRQQENACASALEQQYFLAKQTGKERGAGLGYH